MECVNNQNVDKTAPETEKVNAPETDQTMPNSKEDQTTAELTNDVDALKAQHEATMAEYASYGYYTKRAISSSLLLMRGAQGGGFFVKYLQDEGRGHGWLNLIIVYPDGAFKSILSYKNFLKETDTETSNGVYVAPVVKKPKGYYTYVDWNGYASETLENYCSLEEYATTQMPIPAKVLWHKILENYRRIPVVKIAQSTSIEGLVAALQEWAEIHSYDRDQGFLTDKDRFFVTAQAFREIVEDNGWCVSKARTELDALGIFDKDPSSKGYQKSKRVGGEVQRFYVIKKNPGLLIPPTALDNIEYNRRFEASAEIEKKKFEKLQKEHQELVAKYNKLATKIGGASFEI